MLIQKDQRDLFVTGKILDLTVAFMNCQPSLEKTKKWNYDGTSGHLSIKLEIIKNK
jgi:hypothetical protein